MDPTHWVWRSEVVDERTIASLERWVARPAQSTEEHQRMRRAFTALAAETRRLRAVLGHCPRSIAVLDTEGRLAGYNHEFESHFGDSVTLGEPLASRLDEPDRALFQDVISTTEREGRAGAIVAMRARDGQKKDVEFLVATLPGSDGEGALGVIMAAEDRRGQIERDSARLAGVDEIAQANASSAFSMAEMIVSHDVRNALATAAASLESLVGRHRRGQTLDDPQVSSLLSSALASVQQAGDILKRTQRSARANVVHVEEDADVRASVEVAVRLLEPRARRANVAITIDVAPSLRVAIAPSTLTQVMTNLLTNALHAVEETQRPGSARVWTERVGGERRMIAIHVVDDGVGIEPGRLAGIFELGETTRAAQGGQGLGLAISRHVVEIAGGSLRAASSPGDGTDLIVQLEDRSEEARDAARETTKQTVNG
jgi:signal transduction histidine kinase